MGVTRLPNGQLQLEVLTAVLKATKIGYFPRKVENFLCLNLTSG